ncbi:MAG: type II/IV secretion system ATPase subunit [Methanobacteriota archaeon]
MRPKKKDGRAAQIRSPITIQPRGESSVVSVDDSARNFDAAKVEKGLAKLLSKGRRMRPSFSSSWVLPEPPEGALLLEYRAGGATVGIYRVANTGEVIYHVTPDEFRMPVYQNRLVHEARLEMAARPPGTASKAAGGVGRERARSLAESALMRILMRKGGVAGASLAEVAALSARLADVLARYTVGLGVLEIPLEDPYIQDVYVDAPAGAIPVHVALGPMPVDVGSGKCATNILLTEDEATNVLSRMRLASGRPFSEAMPVLETDLEQFKTRVTVVGKPLSPDGVAIALRRHSTEPWTLPRLIGANSLTPLAAGLLWLLVDGRSTILIAGSRGAGKSSLLSALMLEFPRTQRILTIEDTLELPGPQMQRLGYKVQSLFVRSTLGGTEEMTADDALRVSLRLGESAIVLGEVRGREAKTLYEAMRSGSAGSSVLGTIHGNSPVSVYERIVYDLGIPAKSFNATDIVVVCGLVRPGGGQRQVRRVTSISEVVKSGGGDGAFRELMRYDDAADSLVETEHLRRDSERMAAIATGWGMTYAELLGNMEVRAKLKHSLVAASSRSAEFAGAQWNARSNTHFWNLVGQMSGAPDYDAVYSKWRQWFEGTAGAGL